MTQIDLQKNLDLNIDIAKLLGIEVKQVNIDLNHFNKLWYPKIHLNINGSNYFNFSMEESRMGCGLMMLYSITNFGHDIKMCEKAKLVLDYIVAKILPKVGLLICTLGEGYYNKYEKNMKDIMGFELATEYANPNMSMGTQRVYTKKINQGVVEPKEAVQETSITSYIEY